MIAVIKQFNGDFKITECHTVTREGDLIKFTGKSISTDNVDEFKELSVLCGDKTILEVSNQMSGDTLLAKLPKAFRDVSIGESNVAKGGMTAGNPV